MDNASSALLQASKLGIAFNGFEYSVRWVVEHSVLSRVGIFIGAVLVLQWHIRHMIWGQPEGKLFRWIGIDALVFSIYYQDHLSFLVAGRPFFFTCMLVVFDEVFLFNIGKCILRLKGGNQNQDDTDSRFMTSKFQDLTIRWPTIASMFVIQLFLTLFYILHLDRDTTTHNQEEIRFTQWMLAILLQVIIGEDVVGSGYKQRVWEEIGNTLPQEPGFYYNCWWFSNEWNQQVDLILRQSADYIINGICRNIILATVPILLAGEDSELDFVKDCMAVFFISTLDDTKDEITAMVAKFTTRPAEEAPVQREEVGLYTVLHQLESTSENSENQTSDK